MKHAINPKLKSYIETKILPEYAKNDLGHGADHIRYVINRSLRFAREVEDINLDMVYAIAAYHDIGHHIDAKNHEKVSAEILAADETLHEFFDNEQIKIMSEAVYDHRSSMEGEPRSIYGKIVSSADRNTDINTPLKRTYAYRVEHSPKSTLAEICEESRQHLIRKFGKQGYANDKIYFKDQDYEKFLKDITELTSNKQKFEEAFYRVNKITKEE